MVPGFLAGNYPRTGYEDSSRDKMRRILAAGVTCFVDLTTRHDPLLPYDQLVVQLLLLRSETVVQELASHIQTSALRQEPTHNVQVARGGSRVREGSCVLVDPQQEQRSLDEGEAESCLGDLLHQESGRGARLPPSVARP